MTLAAPPPASAAAAAPCCRQMHRCCLDPLPEPPRWLRSALPGDSRGCGCWRDWPSKPGAQRVISSGVVIA